MAATKTKRKSTRTRRNPEGASESMYSSFHGTPSTETLEYEQSLHYHGNLAALGELVELKVNLLDGNKAVLTFDQSDVQTKNGKKNKNKKSNPFWPFSSFTHSTIYHVGSGREYGKASSHKGYSIYHAKEDEKEYVIPKLDPESRFDSVKDAKKFIDSWQKGRTNPKGKHATGPFHESGKLVGKGLRTLHRPMNQFLDTAGKMGGYLDSRIGKALNPACVMLTSTENGEQMYAIGGDQALDLSSLGITGHEAKKESIPIGEIYELTYHGVKKFDGKFEEYDYVHKLSEDSKGPLPVLIYDARNKRIQFSGGVYHIPKPFLGTSPGITD